MTIREFQAQVAALHSGYTSCGVEARSYEKELEYNVWIGAHKILVSGKTPELAIAAAKNRLAEFDPDTAVKSPDMEIV